MTTPTREEKIEAMARALYVRVNGSPFGFGTFPGTSLEAQCIGHAEAALTALESLSPGAPEGKEEPYNRTQHESYSSALTTALETEMRRGELEFGNTPIMGHFTWEGDWGNLHYIVANALEAVKATVPPTAAPPAPETRAADPIMTHRHYKGGLYRFITPCVREGDLTAMVVYENERGTIFVRPASEFAEKFERIVDDFDVVSPRTYREGVEDAARVVKEIAEGERELRLAAQKARQPGYSAEMDQNRDDATMHLWAEQAATECHRAILSLTREDGHE